MKIKLWSRRIVLGLIAASLALYAGDWALYHLRGEPTATVTVNQFQNVPLKGNKVEYDFLGSDDVPCSVTLFPQGGLSACWRLRRNPNQTVNL